MTTTSRTQAERLCALLTTPHADRTDRDWDDLRDLLDAQEHVTSDTIRLPDGSTAHRTTVWVAA